MDQGKGALVGAREQAHPEHSLTKHDTTYATDALFFEAIRIDPRNPRPAFANPLCNGFGCRYQRRSGWWRSWTNHVSELRVAIGEKVNRVRRKEDDHRH